MKKKTGVNKPTFKIPGFGAGAAIIYGAPGLTENGSVPNITGDVSIKSLWQAATSGGALYTTASTVKVTYDNKDANGDKINHLYFDASRVSSVYNNSTKVYASGLKMRFLIKYI